MSWQYTSYVFPVLLGALITTLISAHAWQRRRAGGALPFAILMLAVTGWALAYTVELGGQDLDTLWLGNLLTYTAVTAVPYFWFWFALQYSHQEKRWGRRNLLLVAAVPVLNLLLLWTNRWHGLMWPEIGTLPYRSLLLLDLSVRGIGFWIFLLLSYGLMAVGTAILMIFLYRRSAFLYWGQSMILLFGVFIPWLGNAIYLAGWSRLDLTPFSLAVGGLLIAWDINRTRLFDVMPVAHQSVWEQMHDGMLLLDGQNRVVELNPAACTIFGCQQAEVMGQPLILLLEGQTTTVASFSSAAKQESPIIITGADGPRSYDLQVSQFLNRFGRKSGRLIVLRDISDRVQADEALHTQKQLLENLVSLASTAKEQELLRAGLQQTLRGLMALTGADSGSLFLLDVNMTGAVVLGHNGVEYEPIPVYFTPAYYNKELVDWVLRQRMVGVVTNTETDQRWQIGAGPRATVGSAVAVPVSGDGDQLIGVISLHHTQPRHFSYEDAGLVQLAAAQMALVLLSQLMLQRQQHMDSRQIITYKLLRTVGELLQPDQVALAAVETVSNLTGWPTVAISTPDAQKHLIIQASVGMLSVDEGVNGRAWRTGKTQIAPDPDLPLHWPVDHTAVAVPMRHGRRQLGVFNVEIDRPNGFSREDILLAESLAEAIVLALENARLYAEMEQRLREQTVLRRAGSLITSTLNLPTVLGNIAQQMGQIVDADHVTICRYDSAQQTGTVMAEYHDPQAAPPAQELDLDDAIYLPDRLPGAAESLEAGQPVTLFVHAEPSAGETGAQQSIQAQTILLIPLQVGGQTRAYAELWEDHQREFTPQETSLCQAIAQQAAIAMENARLFQAVAQEQSQLRAIIEAGRDGIVLVGMDGRLLIVNQPALDALQLSGHPQDWGNRSLPDLLLALRRSDPDAARMIIAETRRVRTGSERLMEGEIELQARAFHWRNLPVLDRDEPLGRLFTLRDITEERLLERMRDDLIHTMVHDLRGPLTSLSVSLHLLKSFSNQTGDDRSLQTLTRADTSMEALLELVNAILDISKLESGRMALDCQPLSLPQLTNRVLDWQYALIEDKHLQLDVEMPTTLPPVLADADLMGRVLQNLLGNAIKFTPDGGQITVSAALNPAVNGSQPQVCVTVRDSGDGIPADIRDRLFQKFTKGGQVAGGSGLGLYFCKMVMEAHDQEIWVSDTSENGTAFNFTLATTTQIS